MAAFPASGTAAEVAPRPTSGEAVAPAVSVIIPVAGESDPLAELYHDHAKALRAAGHAFEFIVAVEPYQARLADPLLELAEEGEPIQVLRLGQSVGEAALVKLAAARCTAPVIVTLPAYRRVSAAAVPHLVDLVERGLDVASARRWPRKDSWVNRLQSRVFNAMIGGLGGGHIADVACGVMAIRREVLADIPLYGDFFRFLPLIALREGYRVQEVAAEQHPRDARVRIYGPGTYIRRLIDVLGLFFLLRFTEKPLRFFGLIGGGTGLAGALILFSIFLDRLQGQPVADRPLLLLGVLLLVLGVQAIALGLVGEIIVHLHAPERRSYRVRDHSVADDSPES